MAYQYSTAGKPGSVYVTCIEIQSRFTEEHCLNTKVNVQYIFLTFHLCGSIRLVPLNSCSSPQNIIPQQCLTKFCNSQNISTLLKMGY